MLVAGCGPTTPPVRERASPSRTAPPPAAAITQPWRARLAYVQDGDSVVLIDEAGQRRTVRLSGIDAPERGQPFADRSRDHLRHLLTGRALLVRPVKRDPYQRVVAQVEIIDGNLPGDAGIAQIRAGLAWYFQRYARDLPAADRDRYAAAEASARVARRGLWSDPNPVPPWVDRQRGR